MTEHSPSNHHSERLFFLVIANGMTVLFIGLIAGVLLIFSLLDAVTIWPLPVWEVSIPGTTRGWQAAHVGGILNGVMIGAGALIMQKLSLSPRRSQWTGWGLILTGWANTIFYWAGNVSQNRGLSVGATPFGEGDIAGAIAFLGGGLGMIFTFIAIAILAKSAFDQAGTTRQSQSLDS
ncbi:MAG: hypothetical protein ACPHAN_10495 [Pseudomonadales bacterium]